MSDDDAMAVILKYSRLKTKLELAMMRAGKPPAKRVGLRFRWQLWREGKQDWQDVRNHK